MVEEDDKDEMTEEELAAQARQEELFRLEQDLMFGRPSAGSSGSSGLTTWSYEPMKGGGGPGLVDYSILQADEDEDDGERSGPVRILGYGSLISKSGKCEHDALI